LRVKLYTEKEAFLLLREEWNRLLVSSPSDTIFLTWEWQSLWWEFFGRGRQLLLLTARHEGELVGIAPLFYAHEGIIRLVGGTEISDYLDIIALSGREREVWSAFLAYLLEECSWDTIDLHNLPAASPTREVLSSLEEKHGLRVEASLEEVCPLILLPETWEGYLQVLDKKRRHELRRKLRKAQREAKVDWYLVSQDVALASEMERFLDLHQRSSPHKDQFMDQAMQRFFKAMAKSTFEAGWLRLGFILINGLKVASLLCFDYGDSILLYNSGYDPERYRALSPGVLATAHCIEEAIQQKKKVFDFLRGSEEYKYRFGARDTEIYRLVVSKV
jgi:CelD/BcsL family acetyltransferase involved in cellulose biosynthesis